VEITEEQYARIKDSLPVQRGNVSLTNLQVLNAILYVAEQGCKWRGLPTRFGRWHTIYMRIEPVGEERRPGPRVLSNCNWSRSCGSGSKHSRSTPLR
jgi:transposase